MPDFIGKRRLLVKNNPLQPLQSAVIATKRLNIGTYCAICHRRARGDIDLCRFCIALLKQCTHQNRAGVTTCVCPACGQEQHCTAKSSIESSGHCGCLTCNSGHRLLHRIVAPYRYAFPLSRLIHRFKYHEQRQLARVLATLLVEEIRRQCASDLPQFIVPMPMPVSRMRARGFNQALDLAHWISKPLNLPVGRDLVTRIEDTESLAGLSRQARQQRILGAFRASEEVQGKHLAIVDDVFTTGASARELARELYDSGAASVELWVLARTSNRRSGA